MARLSDLKVGECYMLPRGNYVYMKICGYSRKDITSVSQNGYTFNHHEVKGLRRVKLKPRMTLEVIPELKEAIEHVRLIDNPDPTRGASSALSYKVFEAAKKYHELTKEQAKEEEHG